MLGILGSFAEFERERIRELTAITIPVLGIVGSADPALKEFQESRTMLPAMQLVVIDGASHTAAPTRPEFVEALIQGLWSTPSFSTSLPRCTLSVSSTW
jgi:pimeloyl-ACP methyl ester carboxylesterase